MRLPVLLLALAAGGASAASSSSSSAVSWCSNSTASAVLTNCGDVCTTGDPCVQYSSSSSCSEASRNDCVRHSSSCTYQCLDAYNSVAKKFTVFVKEPSSSDAWTSSASGSSAAAFPSAEIDTVSGMEYAEATRNIQITGFDDTNVQKGSLKSVTFDEDTFSTATVLEQLILTNLDLGTLPTDFLPTTISLLTMENCNLASLPSQLGNLANKNLVTLNLNKNTMTSITDSGNSVTEALQALTTLNLTDNSIATFEVALPSVTTLDLSDNKLTEFPSVIFNMTNLNVLNIAGNSISSMTVTSTQYSFLRKLSSDSTLSITTSACSSGTATDVLDSVVCVSDDAASSSSSDESSSSSSSTLIIVVVVLAVVVVLGVAGFFFYRRRMKTRGFYLSNTPDMVGVATPPSSNNTPARNRAGSRGRASSQQRPPTAGGRTPRSSIPNVLLAGFSDHGKKMSDAQPRRSSVQSTLPVGGNGRRSRSSIISSNVAQIPSDELNYTRKIAKGAFGEVWLALYGKDLVAVKKLITVEGTSVQDFVSELNLLASLSHRCILSLIGACWDDELTDIQIVMEYMDSGDLLSVLQMDTHQIPYQTLGLEESMIVQQVAVGKLRPKVSDTCPEIIRRLTHECLQYDPIWRTTRPVLQQFSALPLQERDEVSTMNRRSSSTSLQRQIDFTKTVPFVPREVFRLVLRLEAQKALEVNVAALEQRFRVPPGYADDDSLNARGEVKQPKNFVPGPGTYEVPEQWPVRDVTATPTAAFLSKTTRGQLSRTQRISSASPCSPTRQAPMDDVPNDKTVRPQTANPDLPSLSKNKSPRTRLRLPSSSGHQGLRIQILEPQQNEIQDEMNDTSASFSYSSINPGNVSAFSTVGRQLDTDKKTVPDVGSYDIKRLWDSNTRRTTLGAPSPALFGASKVKRVVTWRPAITPASCAVSASWDSSRHYAKQKDKVVRSAAKRRLHSAKLHARTLSTPTLRPSTADPVKPNTEQATTDVPEDDDPFSWLRQRPNGENRVNFLAAKHGLVNHVKSPRRRSSQMIISHGDEQFTPGTPSSRLVQQHSNLQEDGDAATHETVYTAKPKDVRIKVSCRMPGGMLITASVYSMKKLRHFKSAILLRQKRFQSVDQFDLYHMSGRKLTGLEETLVSCGVRDRSMLQIVPAVTVALTPLGNTTGNQEPSNTR
ncbi:hypothetical protein PC116_g6991 [Phytophthora cactorum]|nr:hypothetical protein PC116_g6991 [Phytophthora cactorum]